MMRWQERWVEWSRRSEKAAAVSFSLRAALASVGVRFHGWKPQRCFDNPPSLRLRRTRLRVTLGGRRPPLEDGESDGLFSFSTNRPARCSLHNSGL